MPKWNEIDLDSALNRVKEELTADKDDNEGFEIRDDEGNDITPTKEDVVSKKEEDQVKEPVVSEQKEQKEQKEEKKEFESKAQKRIRELIKKSKEEKAQWQAELEQLRNQFNSLNKESLSTQKESLEARITDTKKALARAHEEGKFDDVAEITTTLSDLQTRKLVVESATDRQETEQKKPAAKQQEEEFDDTQALAWMARNKKWFKKDDLKTSLAVNVSKKIDKEGIFSPDDPAYWDEVDERLNALLGEDDTDEDENLQSSSKKEANKDGKKPPQTTTSSNGGTSRSSSTKSNGGKVEIKLSKEEREWAKKLGMSDLDWAKQKYRMEKSKDENGYQTVFEVA
jgi:hypothetical protein